MASPKISKGNGMPGFFRWSGGLLVSVMLIVIPWVYFRWDYTHAKRLRIVRPGVLYRSGELTADGFREAVDRHQIRTIINLQDEYPDPELFQSYFSTKRVKESDLCRSLGVEYIYIPPDLLSRRELATRGPKAIDRFLDVMDDKANWPVLIHCRAGLHRTGILTSVYRMEYEGWPKSKVVEELKSNGFGEWPCTSSNEYIDQYIVRYQPRRLSASSRFGSATVESRSEPIPGDQTRTKR
jgi:tyrosine-protein phosphatase SIW14